MDYSQILKNAYQQFILRVEGKEVPITYRINIPAIEHPARQGKSSPEVILEQLYMDAKQQDFDLRKASIEEIRQFMLKNNLGLDCSGFAYRMLDFLVQETIGKALTNLGFEHVGRTNVATLTSEEFSLHIKDIAEAKSGDLIRIDSGAEDELLHCLVILDVKDNIITYAHSSRKTKINGIHQDTIKNGKFPADLKHLLFNPKMGDGIYRLKILQ